MKLNEASQQIIDSLYNLVDHSLHDLLIQIR